MHGVAHPVGHLDPGDLADRLPALEHELGHERLEVGEDEDVGAAARRDRAQMVEAVIGRRVERGHHDGVLRREPERDGVADDRVDVAVVGDVLRLTVVGTERHPVRSVLERERQQRPKIPGARGLTDQEPEPGPQPLATLLDGRSLVVGGDPRSRVRVERTARHPGRVAVDVLGQAELRELAFVPRHDAGEVHHLGEPEHVRAPEQSLEVARRERPARRLEPRGRYARRRHEVHVERETGGGVAEPVDAVGAEDVRDLVWVRDDRRRPERQDESRELVDQELRRLDVHVRVDESRYEVAPRDVERLAALVGAEPGDRTVDDRHVGVQPLSREDAEHTPAADDEIGGLVASGDRKPPAKIDGRHGGMIADGNDMVAARMDARG